MHRSLRAVLALAAAGMPAIAFSTAVFAWQGPSIRATATCNNVKVTATDNTAQNFKKAGSGELIFFFGRTQKFMANWKWDTDDRATTQVIATVPGSKFTAGRWTVKLAADQSMEAGFTFPDKCPSPSPSPSSSAPASPAPSSSAPASPSLAAANTALAATGGLDFRFPLVGLTVLVAGLALFLVSSSRGWRSTGDR